MKKITIICEDSEYRDCKIHPVTKIWEIDLYNEDQVIIGNCRDQLSVYQNTEKVIDPIVELGK